MLIMRLFLAGKTKKFTFWYSLAKPQKKLPEFPGPFLFTTNCIQKPAQSYKDSVFTTGLVAWPQISHIANDQFGPVIERSMQITGFTTDEDAGSVWVGYARNTVFQDHPMGSVIGTLVDYVKALSNALGKEISDLPLSLILSWYEQKAVAILLTLFYLGFKGIRLGPTMPAFLTPNVQKVLVDNFNIQPITTPKEDIAACLGG